MNEFEKLIMVPGPTPVREEILTALAEPTISHTSSTIADIIQRSLAGLRRIAETERGEIFVFAGSGTLAQEAAVVNLVAPGERLAVLSNGYFGDRFVALAEAHGIVPERVAAGWGRSVTGAELETVLGRGDVRAVAMTQVDTSTGVLAPVDELAEVASRYGALVILDAVCALGGIPAAMDDRTVDVVLSGAQKALGVPPGLTILAVSERGMERRRSLGRVSLYYADLLNWEASMADPRVYFSTHAVNLFYALAAAIDIILAEGLPSRFARHERLGRGFRAGMEALGFEPLTEAPYLAPTLSVLAYPGGIPDEPFRNSLSDQGIVSAGCLGEFKGRGVRFGHMGNMMESDILRALQAIERVVRDLGGRVDAGMAVAAAEPHLELKAPAP